MPNYVFHITPWDDLDDDEQRKIVLPDRLSDEAPPTELTFGE